MIKTLAGADSAVPQPGFYGGKTIWGIYIAGYTPHIWTHQELAGLRAHGVRGAMPIVVPDQRTEWWHDAAAMTRLAADARLWGLHVGSPLCLDIEQHQAEAIGPLAPRVDLAWAKVCNTYGYKPWTYGGPTWHHLVSDGSHPSSCLKWLAQWPAHTPAAPALPGGYHAWQYAGDLYGGKIDLDVFQAGRTYLGTDGKPATIF